MAAAILAACGGGDDNKGATGDKTGLLAERKDTTKQAVAGSVWQDFALVDVDHFDNITSRTGAQAHSLFAYSSLFRPKAGTPDKPPSSLNFEGDAIESWEIAPDGLQLTMKLRPKVVLDPRPPTNGRALTTQDIVYTWQAYEAKNIAAGFFSNNRDPHSPIKSMTATDDKTVVVKLAFPYAPLIALLGEKTYTYCVMPVERESGFDAKRETRGSGPFMLTDYQPSTRIEWKRNPNYWDAPRPYLDGVTWTILPDYAQQNAQLRNGTLWTNRTIRQEDILPMKRENPKMVVWKNATLALAAGGTAGPAVDTFSAKPGSPFLDVRVRRGLSMLIDRNLLIRTLLNVDAFEKEGIAMSYKQHTLLSAADNNFWVDPTDQKAIGDGAKYQVQNKEEAASLLRAAGTQNLSVPLYVYPLSPLTQPHYEAWAAMAGEGGFFKFTLQPLTPTDWVTKVHTAAGTGHDGLANSGGTVSVDPDFTAIRHSSWSAFRSTPGPPPYDALLDKQRMETDPTKRKQLWKDIQASWANDVTTLNGQPPGIAESLAIAQPFFENFGAILPLRDVPSMETYTYYWYDKSKA
ncbi:MAG TPA: ABC transporter substrate-binding protein [Dehalococcoidia bacterium]|nr:ABC transporter substrate-binding protein [Dehalococcoidia bacterium]